jgi:hypothetical protein
MSTRIVFLVKELTDKIILLHALVKTIITRWLENQTALSAPILSVNHVILLLLHLSVLPALNLISERAFLLALVKQDTMK